MIAQIEPTLYTDPQARKPLGLCPICGRECYGPRCPHCEGRQP